MTKIKIIGGGLAGCEASYQLLKRGYAVQLYEMRPYTKSPAHRTDKLAELVCSNSLKSEIPSTASGALKAELDVLDCLLLRCAGASRVPAGSALAVEREIFSDAVYRNLCGFEKFELIREESTEIYTHAPTIIASGPLTSDKLGDEISRIFGDRDLHFYDAVAPIIDGESIDKDVAFFASRYDENDTDYLNIGMNKEQYDAFYNELINAETVVLKDFEKKEIFEGCMPIEVMAKRGGDSIRFGPLKPIGIRNPKNNEKYYAVAQLRKENNSASMYNMVGFQTNLTFKEQKRVFGMLPSLENAEFLRYGVMHRNTFLNSPEMLNSRLQSKLYENIFFAGQITGVEGYVESIMTGLFAGVYMAAFLENNMLEIPSENTICGSLLRYIASKNDNFQPMNANFGILPQLEIKQKDKKQRKISYYNRSNSDIIDFNVKNKINI